MMKAAEQGVAPDVMTRAMYKNEYGMWTCILELMGKFDLTDDQCRFGSERIEALSNSIFDGLDGLEQKAMLDEAWDRFAKADEIAKALRNYKVPEWNPSKPRVIFVFDEAMQMAKGQIDQLFLSNEVLSCFPRGVFGLYLDTDTTVIAHMRGEV
jgi:hypothetical protein